MKYEYMKEYPCNGERPEGLEDDVLVWYYNPVSMFNSKGVVSSLNWSHISKFKVIDELYKPKSDADIEQDKALTLDELSKIGGAYDEGKSYLCVNSSNCVYLEGRIYETNGRGIVDEFDRGGSTSSCRTGRSSSFTLIHSTKPKSDWFERGEKPPIGIECEVIHDGEWHKTEIVGYDGVNGSIIVYKCAKFNSSIPYDGAFKPNFRPLRTKRDELIDLAEHTIRKAVAANQYHKEAVKILAEAGILKKPEEE